MACVRVWLCVPVEKQPSAETAWQRKHGGVGLLGTLFELAVKIVCVCPFVEGVPCLKARLFLFFGSFLLAEEQKQAEGFVGGEFRSQRKLLEPEESFNHSLSRGSRTRLRCQAHWPANHQLGSAFSWPQEPIPKSTTGLGSPLIFFSVLRECSSSAPPVLL